MLKIPKISIGLPVYNGEAYLAKAIESILDQSYPDFELIISDNASTDRTAEICRDFAARDSRIRFFQNRVNIGGARNHNRVFELARGEFFKLAAHDDLYPREMLERCLEVFEKGSPSIALVYSYFELIDEFGNCVEVRTDLIEKRDPRAHRRLARLLLNIGCYSAIYGLIRSELRRKIQQGSFAYSDGVFLAELAMLGEFREVKEVLLCLRHHSGQSFGANRTPDYIRAWFDPQTARKPHAFPLKARADLEVVRSVLRAPLPLGARILCLLVAVAVPCWLRFRAWSFPLRRRLGLALSVWRKKDKTLILRIDR